MKRSQKDALRRALHYKLQDFRKIFADTHTKMEQDFKDSITSLANQTIAAEAPCKTAWNAEHSRLTAQRNAAVNAIDEKFSKRFERRKKQIFASSAALRARLEKAKAKHEKNVAALRTQYANALDCGRLMSEFDIELEFASGDNVDAMLEDFLRRHGLV